MVCSIFNTLPFIIVPAVQCVSAPGCWSGGAELWGAGLNLIRELLSLSSALSEPLHQSVSHGLSVNWSFLSRPALATSPIVFCWLLPSIFLPITLAVFIWWRWTVMGCLRYKDSSDFICYFVLFHFPCISNLLFFIPSLLLLLLNRWNTMAWRGVWSSTAKVKGPTTPCGSWRNTEEATKRSGVTCNHAATGSQHPQALGWLQVTRVISQSLGKRLTLRATSSHALLVVTRPAFCEADLCFTWQPLSVACQQMWLMCHI